MDGEETNERLEVRKLGNGSKQVFVMGITLFRSSALPPTTRRRDLSGSTWSTQLHRVSVCPVHPPLAPLQRRHTRYSLF